MEHLIISRQLYLDPKFCGEKARKLVGIPRNRFVPFIKLYTGDRFLKYLNRLRIYHAARLLQENPDYGIETVTWESGISALRSFHRLFLEEFGVTPTEYREKSKIADYQINNTGNNTKAAQIRHNKVQDWHNKSFENHCVAIFFIYFWNTKTIKKCVSQ